MAEVRLIPSPPALVDNKNTSIFLSGLLNRSIIDYRSLCLTEPSIFSYLVCLYLKNSSISTSMHVNYENINTFLSSRFILSKSFPKRIIFPDDWVRTLKRSSIVWQSFVSSWSISFIRKGWLQHFPSLFHRYKLIIAEINNN